MNWKLIVPVVVLATGGGYLLGRCARPTPGATPGSAAAPAAAREVYTCSMHPQVRLDRPGKCPICGMPLILAIEPDRRHSMSLARCASSRPVPPQLVH